MSRSSFASISPEVSEASGAPVELTEEQRVEWASAVGMLPDASEVRFSGRLLTQYCRHVVAARRCAELVAALEREQEFDVVAYDRALRMQERESRAIAFLSAQLAGARQNCAPRESGSVLAFA